MTETRESAREVTPIDGNRAKRALAVLAMAGLALFAAALYVPGYAAADATSDALNSTVTLITNLLVALIPLFIIVGVFGIIIGLFAGKKGVFGKLQ